MPNKPTWTPEQQHAIEARGGTLLVSAAAGSGKTAVLIERCIQRLTDTEHLCRADELLIVTFTRAATAEMRTRLSEAVAKKLSEEPDNTHLQTQQMLLPSAEICTIDSFCGTLVREHFEELGLTPDFRMLDETEVSVLQQSALEQTLEEFYERQDPAFLRLSELLSTGRDDASLEENIRRLHTYSRAYPSPEAWLSSAVRLYEDPEPALQIVARSLTELLDGALLQWQHAKHLLETERQPETISFEKTLASIDGYCESLHALRAMVGSGDWEAFRTTVENWDIPRMGAATVPKEEKETFFSPALEYAKTVKAGFTKSGIRAKLLDYPVGNAEDLSADNESLKPLVQVLCGAVLRFDELYAEAKRAENALDFADTELFALRLLVEDPAADALVRTPLAEALRDRFREILIDEYQDTNRLQDAIFSAISRDNLFMVGDVKQSIYRFRQAMPELFLERKESYPLYDPEQDTYPASVILGKNFRSREGVLDTVNDMFTQLMSTDAGEIAYDNSEKLYFGAAGKYEPLETPDAEYHVIVPEQGVDKRAAEAEHIARFIKEEIARSNAAGKERSYKDFAILLRSTKNVAGTYRKTLLENGIPVYAEQGDGFLEAPEVRTMLSFLTVIDNPVQDVPLLATLLSPLFGFTEDDLAAIRIRTRHDKLYKAVLSAAEAGDERCRAFLTELRGYRTLAASCGAGDLLRAVYEKTSYLYLAQSMLGGDQRVANLQQLLDLADRYDVSSSYGLSGFIRHMDRLSEQGGTLSMGATLSPNADVVPIMSIHKSKGLEFPVCILADMNHPFNDDFNKQNVLLHPTLGIGLRGRQEDTGFTYPTLIHRAVRDASRRSERSEALRVLYVAMTRAKEKLVLTAADAPTKKSVNDPFVSAAARAAARRYTEGAVPPAEVLQMNSFYQWTLAALLPHPDAAIFRAALPEGAEDCLPRTDRYDSRIAFVLDRPDANAEAAEPEAPEPMPADPVLQERFRDRMDYAYPYTALSKTLSKRSASHLQEQSFSTEYFAESRPESMSKGGMTPAERGTCLHKFMQYANFAIAAVDPEKEKQRLVHFGFLLPEEAEVVEAEKVRAFLEDPIAARMGKSPRLLREHKFAILVPAGRFDGTLPEEQAEETVLIQGIIDCAFEEDGGLVLLDYKTDRVRNGEQLADRYRDQLDTYRYALEETTGLPVKEVLLYSFALGKTVPVTFE